MGLHLIFVVLVEDMPLKLIQCLICIGAHLARVEFANLDPHVLGTFKSTGSDMLLGLPLVFERLLAARALIVTCSILLWIVLSLLSEVLFKNLRARRLASVH